MAERMKSLIVEIIVHVIETQDPFESKVLFYCCLMRGMLKGATVALENNTRVAQPQCSSVFEAGAESS